MHHMWQKHFGNKIGMNIWLFTHTNSRVNVQNVVRNAGGIPACENTWM